MLNINNFDNRTNEKRLGIILFIIGIIFLLITTYIGLTKIGLWYDELYSIAFAQMSISDMLEIGAKDVHPILYYLIFKLFIKIFTFIDIGVIGKIVSLIPIYLIGLLSMTKVKKNFGYLTAGIFFLCIASMPQLMIYSVELRMYSWGLFFVTASLIYGYELIKNPNLKNWAILTILTIASAYTHYFSAVASFCIYMLLLIYLLKNNKEQLKYWFLSAIISVMVFLPWTFIVLNQMAIYENGFWIKPITINTIISYIYFVLSPATFFIQANELVSPTILGTIILLMFLYLIYKVRDKFATTSIITFILVPIIGVLLSILIQPCFHHRFLIPSVGCLWLGFSILLAKIYENKKLFYIFLAIILIVGIVGCVNFIDIQTQDAIDTQAEMASLNEVLGSGNIIIVDFPPIYFELQGYLVKDNHYLCFIDDVGLHIKETLNDPGIKAEINSGSEVFYVDGGYENIDDVKAAGFSVQEIKFTQTLKGNTFKIYKITAHV